MPLRLSSATKLALSYLLWGPTDRLWQVLDCKFSSLSAVNERGQEMTAQQPMDFTRQVIAVWRGVAMDYFGRLGGAGQYDGFEQWHALGLTLLSALKANNVVDKDAVEKCFKILPRQIFVCDGLHISIMSEFERRRNLDAPLDVQLLSAELIKLWGEMTGSYKGFRFSDFDLSLRTLLREAKSL